MKKILITLFSLIAVSSGYAKSPSRPKLVVGVVVDQMRWDYLYRYYDRYGKGGFKRLMRKGFNCQNTYISYLPSYTAPGHTGIYTGSVPAIHGIAGNDWLEIATGESRYCTQDDREQTVGSSAPAGRMSPRQMLVTTITDELRLATNFRSRVFGIALKDRGAILPAGHKANAAYWFDDSTGNFITSTYYQQQLPAWVNNFNNTRRADSLLQQNWLPLYPLASYTNSIPDDNDYEHLRPGEAMPVFPHLTAGKGYKELRNTPWGNTLTLEMAKACISGEELGSKGNTDFLCISLSSTDYVGHAYAPNSVEVEDVYLRLDQELAALLRFLDKSQGKGNYLIFLSADHGGAHNATFLKDQHIPAGNLPGPQIARTLQQKLKSSFKADSLIRGVYNYQVFLNEDQIRRKRLDRSRIKDSVIAYCSNMTGIALAVDMEKTERVPQPIREMLINGYYPRRSGDIALIYQPAWYSNDTRGTTHGAWNPYDTHIPLLWYGWRIPAGETFRKSSMSDITPTLAALLHLQVPNGCVGSAIELK